MLDKHTERIFFVLVKECKGSSFTVIHIADVVQALPKKTKLDLEGLQSTLLFLESLEFLQLKLMDEEKLCLLILPKGWLYVENKKNEKKIKKAQTVRATLPMGTFFLIWMFSFIGCAMSILLFQWLLGR